MNIFTLDSLDTGYNNFQVLHNVNISVKKNEFIGIIGPNGSGKSTLLKSLIGLLKPFNGLVKFNDEDISKIQTLELAKNISFVPQFIENLVAFTVIDFIATGRFPFLKVFQSLSAEDEDAIHQSLEIADVFHLKDRLLTELSGGELQLVNIARAFTQNEKIILLDEPISNLDYNHSIKIMDVLFNLHVQGSTIITVLHNINIASDYCSRIIALKKGAVFADGKPADVINEALIQDLFSIKNKIGINPVTEKPYVYTYPTYKKK